MKVLVTGHKGYIGGHLYKDLVNLGHTTYGIDLKEGQDILHCLPDENFDCVFHLAAIPSVPLSVQQPSYTLRQNVLATSVLLEWSKNHGVKRFIFSSSAAAENIKSPYGLHKRMGEMECKLYSELYELDTVCLRYFNVYSEDQEHGGAYSSVISAWMEAIRNNRPLHIHGDGQQQRDFIHISDILNANVFCMQRHFTDPFGGEVFDVGTGTSIDLNFIKYFIDRSCSNISWIHKPPREGDIRNSRANSRPIRKKTGWEPEVSIAEGLQRCFNVK